MARAPKKILDTEQARLLALENTTEDDFLRVVAIRRELGKLKRYLKVPNTVGVEAPRDQTKPPVRTLHARQQIETKRLRRPRQRI